MSGSHSRNKGSRGEREAAAVLTELTGYTWERSIGQTRRGGSEVPDVASVEWPHVHVEVKRGKAIGLWGALRQAVDDAGDSGRTPVVMARRDREGWVLVVRLEDVGDLNGLLEALDS